MAARKAKDGSSSLAARLNKATAAAKSKSLSPSVSAKARDAVEETIRSLAKDERKATDSMRGDTQRLATLEAKAAKAAATAAEAVEAVRAL